MPKLTGTTYLGCKLFGVSFALKLKNLFYLVIEKNKIAFSCVIIVVVIFNVLNLTYSVVKSSNDYILDDNYYFFHVSSISERLKGKKLTIKDGYIIYRIAIKH